MRCASRRRLAGRAVGLCGLVLWLASAACYSSDPPVTVEAWVWSDGPRRAHLESLFERYNGAQERVVVEAGPWPAAIRDAASTRELAAALAATKGRPDVPALVEVPDHVLPALVEAGLAIDLAGRFAERLGVRFDDFEPCLMSAARLRAEGVRGLPLYQEVPLLVVGADGPTPEAVRAGGLRALISAPAPAPAPLSADAGADADAAVEPSPRSATSPRPLAAGADHRLVLSLLRGREAFEYPEDGPPGLREAAWREALEALAALLPEGATAPSSGAAARAVAAVRQGRARAALVWSPGLAELDAAGLVFLRAPLRTRGTVLVVHAGAGWRARQAAFRIARWVTEPQQAADLARRFVLAPLRRSAARSARLATSPVPPSLRQEIARCGEPTVLPASGALMDTLIDLAEPGLVNDVDLAQWVGRLQRALAATDVERGRRAGGGAPPTR